MCGSKFCAYEILKTFRAIVLSHNKKKNIFALVFRLSTLIVFPGAYPNPRPRPRVKVKVSSRRKISV